MYTSKFPLTSELIASAYLDACRLEVRSLKPGNVHVYSEGHGMTVEQFDRSAEISAPFISDETLSVGARIRKSVEGTLQTVHTNTNLGILLLCAPLAAAAQLRGSEAPLNQRLSFILSHLTHQDASEVYRAILQAQPAGLGHVAEGDVDRDPPQKWTLLDAMRESASHDLIARQYVQKFSDLIVCAEIFQSSVEDGVTREVALSFVFVQKLAEIPDTHIIRKHGAAAAEWVQKNASECLKILKISKAKDLSNAQSMDQLMCLDAKLKSKGYNPGSLADLVCGSVFYTNLCPSFKGTHLKL